MKFRLLQLLADNRGRGPVRSKIVASQSGGEATIYLYDPIVSDRMTAEYYGCVCAQDLVPEIDSLTVDTIRLKIKCPGGDVFAMQAIMASLRNHKARVIAQVEGLAASAATGIAMVCDAVIMEPGALFMIHNSQGLAFGDKNEMRKTAELMEKVDLGLIDSYQKKTGKTRDEIAAWMDAETWFTADEAVAAGFADQVSEAKEKDMTALSEWDLSAFANAPKIACITDDHRARQRQRMRLSAVLR